MSERVRPADVDTARRLAKMMLEGRYDPRGPHDLAGTAANLLIELAREIEGLRLLVSTECGEIYAPLGVMLPGISELVCDRPKGHQGAHGHAEPDRLPNPPQFGLGA